MRTIEVKEKTALLDFLFKHLSEYKKTNVRQLLKFGHIAVNGQVTTQFNRPLEPGDQVIIESKNRPTLNLFQKYKIELIHEDEDIIVIDKPSGLLAIATEQIKTKTAYHIVNEYVKNTSRGRIFVVHRLDQGTSGLLVFAKDPDVKRSLQKKWEHVKKRYFAVVHGKPPEPSGEIISKLRQNKFLQVYSTNDEKETYKSITRYRLVKTTKHYSLLDVELETGRKHQIRVHLSDLGMPVVGDDRYSEGKKENVPLALHAYYLSFEHPRHKKQLVFRTKLPERLAQLIDA